MPYDLIKNEDEIMTPDAKRKLRNLLLLEEGYKGDVYTDTTGNLTIGIGRNLSDRGISMDEALVLLDNDIAYFSGRLSHMLPFFDDLSDARKIALVSLCFNLGVQGFMGFKKMSEAVSAGNYALAAHEILASKAAIQLPTRYQRLSTMMRTNEL